ncbi:hypothetical protein ACSEQ8_26495 [Pseudomonas aeruginosa]|uniref:hypothetical protein n=1 Tax=Pseudomonas aeruginosa TaxID=287 RepID=UPI000E2A2AF3|nr:hypothetical protein [Pseudomonas aeruginosa]MCT5065201.1 hypothetical protein [Pseudomonas aeruginosa]
MTESKICTCPSGDGSLRHPCPAHPAVEQAGGDERDFQAKGAQEVPSPVSKEYDRHLIGLLRKGEALPGHQEEAADEIERLRDWNDHLNNTVLPNILNPNFLMLMKGGERLLDLCTKDGKFIGVSLNDMKDVFDWMVTHARIAPDHAALAQPSPASDLDPLNLAPHAEAFNEAPDEALRPEQAEAERPEVVAWQYRVTAGPQTGWSLWHPGKGEEFERSYTVERRPLMTIAQHECIVGELRAVIAQLRQHKNDYMDSGQETYRALQNEIREREAEIARLDGLVSGRMAERDAALARVAEVEAKLADLEKQEPFYYFADCDDTDHSGLHNTLGDALTQVADHGGSVVELYRKPPAQAQHSVPVAREQLERLVRILDAHNYAKDAEALMALLAAAPGKEVPQAWLDVQAERRRQVEAEGWTPEHDDEHADGQMARAAACYALAGSSAPNDGTAALLVSLAWPWDEQWWKPSTARRDLVKACALALAEIERLDRACISQSPQPGATTASS